ncbi:MAG: hemin uptake protein HemP [Rhodocyclales bacterium]|nr:hemin uptake protein HemP [Rhodocyclales bacterium]
MLLTSPSTPAAAGSPPASGRRGPAPRPLDSVTLLGGGTELLIRHGTETYRLRVTRQNRLILTK